MKEEDVVLKGEAFTIDAQTYNVTISLTIT